MEFASRSKCIDHFQEQFPNLPRYMIEIALDYDLENGGGTNEKPKTGKEKRKARKNKKEQVKRGQLNTELKEALESGKQLEIDCAKVIPRELYEPAPFLPGHIEVDGSAVAESFEMVENSEEINLS